MRSCTICHSSYPDNVPVCPQDGTPLGTPHPWSPGALIQGKYEILTNTGEGSIGAVYKARDLGSQEIRALRVIRPELIRDAYFVKRFKQEAAMLQTLRHPNLVGVEAVSEAEDGRPFIVMEYVEGRDLKKVIQAEAPMSASRVCGVTKQVAAALDAAHKIGMIHGNIKPADMALLATPHGERVKVLDFGMARLKEIRRRKHAPGDRAQTLRELIIGMPQYMSPEQAAGKHISDLDGRSDLYSVGVVMYEMLTGQLPLAVFADPDYDSPLEVLVAQLETPPSPFDTTGAQVPEPLAALVMRLLEKKPELRPATAQSLIDELNHVEERIVPSKVYLQAPEMPMSLVTVPAAEFGAGPPRLGIDNEETVLQQPSAAPPPLSSGASSLLTDAPSPTTREKQPRFGSILFKPPAALRGRHRLRWLSVVAGLVALGGGAWLFTVYRPRLVTATRDEMIRVFGPQQSKSPAPETAQRPLTPSVPSAASGAQGVRAPASSSQAPAESGPSLSPPQASPPNSQRRVPVTTVVPNKGEAGARAKSATIKPGNSAPARKRAVDAALIQASISEGDAFFELGDYDHAIAAYEGALKIDPNIQILKQRVERTKKAKAAEEKYLSQ